MGRYVIRQVGTRAGFGRRRSPSENEFVTSTRRIFSARVRWMAMVGLINAALLLGSPTDAQAYLDPGTGSMIIQVVVAGIAAGLLLVKTYWRRLKAFFSREAAEQAPPTPDTK